MPCSSSTGTFQSVTFQQTQPVEGSRLFGKDEIPVIIFGILFAMLFIFAAGTPQTAVSRTPKLYGHSSTDGGP